MLNHQELLEMYKWELPVLKNVVAAIPESGFDYQPDPKSRTVKALITTMIVEVKMTNHFLSGGSIGLDGGDFYSGVKPATMAEAVELLEQAIKEFLSNLEQSSDEKLQTEVQFFHRKTTSADAMFNMMLDLIHHRGQLSAYIRAAGGKVPSIYGPSGDEEFKG